MTSQVTAILGQCVEKPRDLPRDSIHHDTPKALPRNVILLSSRTSKWDLFQPGVSSNCLSAMETLGSIMVNIPPQLLQTLTVLNLIY